MWPKIRAKLLCPGSQLQSPSSVYIPCQQCSFSSGQLHLKSRASGIKLIHKKDVGVQRTRNKRYSVLKDIMSMKVTYMKSVKMLTKCIQKNPFSPPII